MTPRPLAHLLAAALCLWFVAPPATRADEKTLEQSLLPAARAGDAAAQFALGQLYTNSPSLAMIRPVDAEQWLLKAADQNHTGAILALVDLYSLQRNLGADDADIARWLARAAALGHTRSAARLGVMLWSGGRGLDADRPKAYGLLRDAAMLGEEEACLVLAGHALGGVGLRRDVAKVRQMLRWAADHGSTLAALHLATLPDDARALPTSALAVRALEKMAKQNDAHAMSLLGRAFESNAGVDTRLKGDSLAERFTFAREWYEKAAAKNDPEAAARLGILCAKGLGGPRDAARALASFEQAAAAGNALGQLDLAMFLLDRTDPKPDSARIRTLLETAAATNANAAFELAMLFYEGNLTARDPARAAALFAQAAQLGHTGACLNLGVMSANAEAGPADPTEAVKWWRLAQLAGSRDVAKFLARLEPQLTTEQRTAATERVRAWQEARRLTRDSQLVQLALTR